MNYAFSSWNLFRLLWFGDLSIMVFSIGPLLSGEPLLLGGPLLSEITGKGPKCFRVAATFGTLRY